MTQRERLIDLIISADISLWGSDKPYAEVYADHLLDNGVIVPPCKIGDKVWFIRKDRVPDDDYRVSFHDEWVLCEVDFQLSMINQIDRNVFITREEAEKALSERSGEC